MASSTYEAMWRESQVVLAELLAQELPAEPRKAERNTAFFWHGLATLFVRYLQIVRRLEACYDQGLQPQKRPILRRLLDSVLGRLVELKQELVAFQLSEYHYVDHVLQELHLCPADLEVPIPRYFLHERAKALQERKEVLAEILARVAPSKVAVTLRPSMLREEAVRLIQMAERMRQGRLRARFMQEIRRDEERERKAREGGPPNRTQAAVCIQKVWKGCLQRRLTQLARQQEMAFIGMALEPELTGAPPATLRAQLGEEIRRMRQADYEAEYQEALNSIRDTVYEVEGPSMREEMKAHLRQWFIECRELTGRFPDFPEEAIGGSSILFAQKTPEEVRAELDLAEVKVEKKKEKGKEKDKKQGKEKAKEVEKKKGKQKKSEEDEGLKLSPSKFLTAIDQGFREYTALWSGQDEVANFEQRYEVELIRAEKQKEVAVEIRLQVDELMRQELRHLKLAVDLEDIKVGKPPKAKKSAKKKGKKGTKEKDLTPDRPIDSLYEELVLQGILVQAPKVQLSDYSGDFCYLGTTLRQVEIEPVPSTLDVRQNIALYAILPLGSPTVHELAPLVRSVLLVGPAGTGKKMLVHAVCTETGANLFDLSPDNLAGKYPGKSGLQMLIHLVFKVARALQPSVLWVGNAEKTFYKKVPKEEKELDPKRLKKDLPKALNLLTPADRVLLLGTSSKPYLADAKALCKAYERILLIPRPDYASRYVTWQQLIKKQGGILASSLDLSALAKVSDGYSQGSMARAVQAALSERRLLQLPKRPLVATEFLQMLARAEPIHPEEETLLQDWYAKTPLGKKRLLAEEEKRKAAESKGKDKKKKKK